MHAKSGMAAMSALLGFLSAAAAAQPVSSFRDIPLRVHVGARVIVEPVTGPAVKGTLKLIDPDALVIESGAGDVRVAAEEVRRLLRRGRAWRAGTLIGFGTGAVFGVLAAHALSDHPSADDFFQGIGIFGGLGAAMGVGIGALVPTASVVYHTPGETSAIMPLGVPRGAALGVRITW
jgi:hypothetical protein